MGCLSKMHIPGLHPTWLKAALLDWMKIVTLFFFFFLKRHPKGLLCILTFVIHNYSQELYVQTQVRKLRRKMRGQGDLGSHFNCFGDKTRTAVPTKKKCIDIFLGGKKRGWIFRTIYPYHLTPEVKTGRHQDWLPPLVSRTVAFLNPNISGRAGLGRGEGCRCYFACLWRNIQMGMPSRQ